MNAVVNDHDKPVMPFSNILSSTKLQVMGVLNVTPDSFYDGGNYDTHDAAIQQAVKIVGEGASILDVGGESTRPHAVFVSEQEELDRVIPVIDYIAHNLDVTISIDTSRPKVMQEAVKAGATFINDVRALTKPGALAMAASLQVPVCIMHMQNQPNNMQVEPAYTDVVIEVSDYLRERVNVCMQQGIDKSMICIDPGFGFGKTLAHNLLLLRSLEEFKPIGCCIMAGLSRKSMFGKILDKPAEGRLWGSVAGAVIAATRGANIIRTHDVAPTVDALKVVQATLIQD